MTVVDIQFSPANTDWATLKAATLTAERREFGAVFVFDHLSGQPLGGTSMLECFAVLGALAEATTQIELGTMVANVWNRQVGTLVSAAASIAVMSGRPFHLGIGAGASPTSAWAAEQHAAGAYVEPSVAARLARVQEVLDLSARQWAPERDTDQATFPLPTPPPSRIVGVNSERLSRIAERSADGINLPWSHPQRDNFLAAANESAGARPFLRTAYTTYDADLLDPAHPDRPSRTGRLRCPRRLGVGSPASLGDPIPASTL